jgi:hypothetical protein
LRILPIDGIRPQQSAPQHRRHAQIVEAVGDQADDVHILRQVVAGHGHGVVVHRKRVLDGAHLPQLLNLRRVQIDQFHGAGPGPHRHPHDAVRRGKGVGVQQRGIDHAEYRRSGSHAEGQRDHRGQCESWTFDELPHRIAQVLNQCRHRWLAL